MKIEELKKLFILHEEYNKHDYDSNHVCKGCLIPRNLKSDFIPDISDMGEDDRIEYIAWRRSLKKEFSPEMYKNAAKYLKGCDKKKIVSKLRRSILVFIKEAK